MGTTEATEKGHLDQERKGLPSTKTLIEIQDSEDNYFPLKQPTQSFNQFTTNVNTISSRAYSMDLIGKFSYTSSRGYKYLVLLYNYDSNAIVLEPIKTRQSKEFIDAFKICEWDISSNNQSTNSYILDNEALMDFKTHSNT